MNFLRRLVLALFALTGSIASADSLRCAFDVGSGGIRVRSNTTPVVAQQVDLPIKKSVQEGILPPSMVQSILAALEPMKSACIAAGVNQFFGVATSGFRAATRNGAEAAREISSKSGVEIKVVSPEEEGRIGFLSALSKLPRPPKSVLVWDIGGGSMQFALGTKTTAGSWQVEVESIDVGAAVFLEEVLPKALGRPSQSEIHPINTKQRSAGLTSAKSLLNRLPPAFLAKLKSRRAKLVGIGGVHADLGSKLGGSTNEYTLGSARRELARLLGKSLEDIRKDDPAHRFPQNRVSNLILITGMLDTLGQTKVQPLTVNLTDGLLFE